MMSEIEPPENRATESTAADPSGNGAPPGTVTRAELSVLRQLWRRGPSTIRQLADTLYPAGGSSAYGTVQKLLERLEAKTCVGRSAEGRAHVFTAAVTRGQLIARRLQETADAFCEGALSPLLTHLVDHADLSAEDLGRLRRLVREEGNAVEREEAP